jgi:hypothetical protein
MSASPAQIDFCNRLYAERDVPDEVRELVAAKARVLAPKDFSRVIDVIKAIPKKSVPVLEPGTYQDGDVIFRVQVSRESSRPYALVLDAESGRFTYDGGAYRQHAASAQPITFEQAMELGARYNRCIHCGRDLTAVDSVLLSIGPWCAEKHHGVSQAELVARMRAAQAEQAVMV